jgi:hypothetical protein
MRKITDILEAGSGVSATAKTALQENLTCALLDMYARKKGGLPARDADALVEWFAAGGADSLGVETHPSVLTDEYVRSYHYQCASLLGWMRGRGLDPAKYEFQRHETRGGCPASERVEAAVKRYNHDPEAGFPIPHRKDNFQKADIYVYRRDADISPVPEDTLNAEIDFWNRAAEEDALFGVSLKVISGEVDAEMSSAASEVAFSPDQRFVFDTSFWKRGGRGKAGGTTVSIKDMLISEGESQWDVDLYFRTNTSKGSATVQFGAASRVEIEIEMRKGKMNAQLGKAGLAFRMRMKGLSSPELKGGTCTVQDWIDAYDSFRGGPMRPMLGAGWTAANRQMLEAAWDPETGDAGWRNGIINVLNLLLKVEAFVKESVAEPSEALADLFISLYRGARGITEYSLPCLDLY